MPDFFLKDIDRKGCLLYISVNFLVKYTTVVLTKLSACKTLRVTMKNRLFNRTEYLRYPSLSKMCRIRFLTESEFLNIEKRLIVNVR